MESVAVKYNPILESISKKISDDNKKHSTNIPMNW